MSKWSRDLLNYLYDYWHAKTETGEGGWVANREGKGAGWRAEKRRGLGGKPRSEGGWVASREGEGGEKDGVEDSERLCN